MPRKTMICASFGRPITLTIDFPLYISQTSLDVDDMSSSSAEALFSRARPMKERAMFGPCTRMAAVMTATMPKGTAAKMI